MTKASFYTYICNEEVASDDYNTLPEAIWAAKQESLRTGAMARVFKLFGDEELIEDGIEIAV